MDPATAGQLVHVECRAYYRGVRHDKKDKLGLVQFELQIINDKWCLIFLVNWAVFWIQKEFLFFLGQICNVHWIRNKKNTWANLHFTFTCFLCLSVSRYWPLVNFPGPDHCLQAFRELTYVGWHFFLWWHSTFLGKPSKNGLFDDFPFSFPLVNQLSRWHCHKVNVVIDNLWIICDVLLIWYRTVFWVNKN